ncbi:Carbohydrate-selective porin, OprB family [Planctomycetes bacterium CA13]|uniref:Carbohydrate-selective porin, OprB family n=1 Tax=Novipirellula herctigrandis TaxID=2527986 RepID=A0A5C5Z2V6_9BACT|nr:Carbohydrate-selective porin, OprB family [Planctomycetes bacterium CA13]
MSRIFWIAAFLAFFVATQSTPLFAQCDLCGAGNSCWMCEPSSACDSLGACDSQRGDCDACGCASCKSCLGGEHLLGDWGGLRSRLAQRGVVTDIRATQFYQGVSSGGNNERFRYGGKVDYNFAFLGEPLGLNKGFTLLMHAETRFGQDSILDAVGLAPSNANMLMPTLENETAITGFQVLQALNEDWAVTFGKINVLDLFNTIFPQTGRGIDRFMNASSFFPLTVATTVPLSFNGAGVLKMNEGRIQGGLLVLDSNNIPTTSGLSQLFDNGANIAGLWRFFTNFGGQPGSHLFLGTYGTGTFNSLDPNGWAFVPGEGLVAPNATGSWSATYFLEQQLWADHCDADRNIGLFSQWGLADKETSPYQWCMNISLDAMGLVRGRPQDRMGAAYFYSGLSSDLKTLAAPLIPLDDVQGAELYYNAAITPWCYLTTDLQIVEPANERNDTATVLGMRLSIDL